MKLLLQFMAGLLLWATLAGCDKPPTPQLIGEWRWETSSGGFGGFIYKPSLNEPIILRFEKSGRLSMTKKDTLVLSAKYIVGKTADQSGYVLAIINHEVQTERINWPFPAFAGKQEINIRGNQLTLSDTEISDGFSHIFIKR